MGYWLLSTAALFVLVLAAGGPVIPVWGWPLVVFFTFTIALSMAEICSALPTSGGVYFWSGVLAGPYGPLFSWISGWLQMLGQVSERGGGLAHAALCAARARLERRCGVGCSVRRLRAAVWRVRVLIACVEVG